MVRFDGEEHYKLYLENLKRMFIVERYSTPRAGRIKVGIGNKAARWYLIRKDAKGDEYIMFRQGRIYIKDIGGLNSNA